MICFNNLEEIAIDGKTAVTVGKFDGLHTGHMKLIRAVTARKKDGMKSVLVSFDFNLLSGEKRRQILSRNEFTEILQEAGVDIFVCIPFTREFALLSAEAFVTDILVRKLHAGFIACGEDFHFGKNREGGPETLVKLEKAGGYRTAVYKKSARNRQIVSSTLIRGFLSAGKVKDAALYAGHPYRISGTVVHGLRLATELGYPTLNVAPPEDKFLPKFGVYYVRVTMDGKEYDGMANIGVKPTITNEDIPLLETYLLDTEGDFYGKETVTEFIRFIRPEQKFASVEALEAQIGKDLKRVREFSVKFAGSIDK